MLSEDSPCTPLLPLGLTDSPQLSHRKEFDFHTGFIELAGEVNLAMPYHFVNSVAQGLNKKVLSYVTPSVTHLG